MLENTEGREDILLGANPEEADNCLPKNLKIILSKRDSL